MRKMLLVLVLTLLFTVISGTVVNAAGLEDYLILNDIGDYKRKVKTIGIDDVEKPIPGYWVISGAESLRGTGHFTLDHDDITYETVYINSVVDNYAEVQVTQHAGGESDRWLLHELEEPSRSQDFSTFRSMIKEIDGNRIFSPKFGTEYAWPSANNVIVYISYTDSQLEKPEPWDVVRAYLQKFPSTLTMTNDEAKSSAHDKKWIRDEMDRKLWLCDKWSGAYAAGKVEKSDVLFELEKNLRNFVGYRKKFYGVSYGSDPALLQQYRYETQDVEGMRKKLAEYKAWWAEYKGDTPDVPSSDEVKKRQDDLFK